MYDETFHVRLTRKQMDKLSEFAGKTHQSMADIVRHGIDVVTSEDHVVVPLGTKERLFIEGICDTAGVQPSDAVKIVLLSYHTLLSSPLWKIVKPVDKILEEMNKDE